MIHLEGDHKQVALTPGQKGWYFHILRDICCKSIQEQFSCKSITN